MLKRRLVTLLGVVAIPFAPSQDWFHFEYKKIKPSTVEQRPDALVINVEDSASPLFYRLGGVKLVSGVRIKGSFKGTLKAETKEDDFPLRLGLVVEGQKRLSWLERLFAPLWLKQLHDIEPERAVKKIHFLVFSHRDVGVKTRQHPRTDYVTEEFVEIVGEGNFSGEYAVAPPLPTFALWFQADGDDSRSSFSLKLDELSLKTEDINP